MGSGKQQIKRKQLSSIEGFFVTERNVNIYKKKCGSMNLEKHINIIMEHAASNLSYDKCVQMFLTEGVLNWDPDQEY